VYEKARQNLEALCRDGALVRDAAPSVYLYELSTAAHTQLGIVGCVHIDDYGQNVIRRHEKTRKEKEDDRTRHVLTLRAHAEPVFLMFPSHPFMAQLNAKATLEPPLYDFTASDGVRHRVWRVVDPSSHIDAFRRMPAAYVADGHHRCASAWRAGAELRAANPVHTGNEEYNWFLAVLFPANQLQILPYNRVIRDLGGKTPEQFLAALRGVGAVTPASAPDPAAAGSFGVYLAGRWHRLTLDPGTIPQGDPVGSLDAALLETRVLGPLLGIGDIRTDQRVDFVGGSRGSAELARRVDAGEAAVAFAMYPVTVQQLMTVSDAGAIMPPKSTWFEPKLRSGLFVHTLD
jgi:uncharacterized protein (DUF1015 family)